LNQIKKVIRHFDVVAIIRGGGGDVGLSCYNQYQLVREIALFPIPVITGIGHATNETVAEMVAFSNAITPTKMAEYLLQRFHNFSVPVQDAEVKIIDKARRLIDEEKSKFSLETKLFRSVTHNILIQNKNKLKECIQTFTQQSRFLFRNELTLLSAMKAAIGKSSRNLLVDDGKKIHLAAQRFSDRSLLFIRDRKNELINFEKNIGNMSPENVLKRGYSITRLDGKAVRSVGQVNKGDQLKTVVFDGQIDSTVESVGR
jgi:exodeoxyribonuclease VII large subunit